MSDHDIKLPPLPKGDIAADTCPVMWVHTDQQIESYAREAIKADRQRRGISNECEPVVLATYYAIFDRSEKHIMQDMRTNQLEIYDEREDAVKAAPDHLSVVPVYVTDTEGPLYTAPQPAEPVVKESLTVPDGWQLVPTTPTMEMVQAMEQQK